MFKRIRRYLRRRYRRHAWINEHLPTELSSTPLRLRMGNRPAGFFSHYFQALGALDICQHREWNLRISFEDGCYLDPKHGPNWWAYFFDQSEFSFAKMDTENFPASFKLCRKLSNHGRQLPLKIAHRLSRMIPINDSVNQQVAAEISEWPEDVVGVHYRGTDKSVNETVRVPYSFVEESLRSRFGKEQHFFVATDEVAFLNHLQQHFPNRILATSAIRSDGELPPHKQERHSGYTLGRDALVDCLLLSRCRELLRTDSNLSLAAKILNPQQPSTNLSTEFRRYENERKSHAS